jgi:ribosomal protein S18 acetylase RimI-like enzyme
MNVSSNLLIRPGTVSDAAALVAFATHTFAQTYAADNQPENMKAHLMSSFGMAQQSEELASPDVTTLLAYDDERLVAYAQIRRQTPPLCVTQEGSVELRRFYVDRPAHGLGIAQRLMDATFTGALALDGRHLWLGVWEQNPRAIAFYKKVGFVDVGSKNFVVGLDRQTDRVLVAKLVGGTVADRSANSHSSFRTPSPMRTPQ